MPRQTSIEVYNTIKNNGLLSKLRFETYKLLYEYGPMSANELFHKAKEVYNNANLRDTYHQRLSELKEQNVCIEVDKRDCKITGREVLIWDVTNNLPTKFSRSKSKDQIIKELQARINELEKLYDVTIV